MQNTDISPTEITVWIEAHLQESIQASGGQAELVAAVENAASRVLSEIGLPAQARVSLQAGIPGEHRAALLALQVNSQTLSSPPGMENRLLAVQSGRLLEPGEGGPAIPGWVEKAFRESEPETLQAAIQYLAGLCHAILGEHPELLLDEPQVRELQTHWSQTAPGIARLKTAWLEAVLSELLRVHLPLGGDGRLPPLLLENRRAKPAQAAEAAISALLPPTLELCLPRHLLKAYTLEDLRYPASELAAISTLELTSQSTAAFNQASQQIFADLGLNLPPLEFAVGDEPDRHFSFRINGLPSLPYPALPPGKVLVDAAPQTLEMMNVSAQAVLHPLDGRLCSLVSLGDEAPPSEKGYTTWTGIEYLALCLGHALRSRPWCLVHNLAVGVWLEEIAKNSPELVKAIYNAFPDIYTQSILTQTLRRLVLQGVSMVELPQILESLLRPALVEVPSPDWHVVGNAALPASARLARSDWRSDPDILAAFARWRLSLPAIALHPAQRSSATAPRRITSLEQYAEPLTQDQRIAELTKRYSNEDLQHYLSMISVTLVIMQEPELPDFVDEKISELFAKLGLNSETPAEQMLEAITEYFVQNPVNPQLIQDSTAAIRAEVPANADAFTSLWRSKYAM